MAAGSPAYEPAESGSEPNTAPSRGRRLVLLSLERLTYTAAGCRLDAVTGRVAAALAISATAIAAAVPGVASAAKTGSIYDMTSARGFEKVTFTGDSSAGCEQFAVCGYKGTVRYAIGGTPKGTLLLARSRSGRYTGGATYRTAGVTTTSVSPPDGSANCTDTVRHKTDVFEMSSLKNSVRTLLLSYHDGGDDYLDTACAGPTERDVAAANAFPEGTFAASGFKAKRVKWGLSGALQFRGSGFSATSEWKLNFKASRRLCSPRCRIPAQRPR